MDLIPFNLSNYTLENYLLKITTRTRIIYWVIIGYAIAAIAALPLISVDVPVQARGFFQSEIEKQTILAPFQGRVIYASLKNGQYIRKGDTLLIIDSEASRAQKRSILDKLMRNDSAISDLEKLTVLSKPDNRLKASDFNTERYFSEFSAMIKTWNIQYQKYLKARATHQRNEILHEKEIIPDNEYESTLYVYRSEAENLNQVLIQHKSMWQTDLLQRKIDAGTFQAELGRYSDELNNRIVVSPVSGDIIQSADIQEGTIVSMNQLVAEISPEGNLLATCFVRPSDIGLIRADQKVRIQVDAFNYNEWGLLTASILDISNDIIVQNGNEAYFRIRCKPESASLYMKNGLKADIRKGMSFNARIIVTRRSLFNLLFDKADDWFNPYSNQEEG